MDSNFSFIKRTLSVNTLNGPSHFSKKKLKIKNFGPFLALNWLEQLRIEILDSFLLVFSYVLCIDIPNYVMLKFEIIVR